MKHKSTPTNPHFDVCMDTCIYSILNFSDILLVPTPGQRKINKKNNTYVSQTCLYP